MTFRSPPGRNPGRHADRYSAAWLELFHRWRESFIVPTPFLLRRGRYREDYLC